MSSKSLTEMAKELYETVKESPDYDWSFGKFHKMVRQHFGELYQIDILPQSEEILIPEHNLESIETELLNRIDQKLFFSWFSKKVCSEPDGPLDSDDIEQGLELLRSQDADLQDEDLRAAINRQLTKEMFKAILEADAIIDNMKLGIKAQSLAIPDMEGIEALAAAKTFRKTIIASLNECHRQIIKPPKLFLLQ